jgi:DNA-binding Lrp family transcriptional regulator
VVAGKTCFPAGDSCSRVRQVKTARPKDKPMKLIFLQIKTEPGTAYEVAADLADTEIASEIYSTSGQYDLLAKIYVDDNQDIGHVVANLAKRLKHVRDTYTIITHRAF